MNIEEREFLAEVGARGGGRREERGLTQARPLSLTVPSRETVKGSVLRDCDPSLVRRDSRNNGQRAKDVVAARRGGVVLHLGLPVGGGCRRRGDIHPAAL